VHPTGEAHTLEPSLIAIVDDEEAVRKAIERLLKSAGLKAEAFASAEVFMQSGRLNDAACVIVDMRLGGMTGLQLQRRLAKSGHRKPIVFITALDSPEVRARALRAGAIDVLRKPFSDEALLQAIQVALTKIPH
jgi:FixJ family two-component response regulator